ncbi:MAG: hypothetical protein C0524_03560 [Rhodobacter sp.]|nr:hypothetical protein [Rhodobacter sp.]
MDRTGKGNDRSKSPGWPFGRRAQLRLDRPAKEHPPVSSGSGAAAFGSGDPDQFVAGGASVVSSAGAAASPAAGAGDSEAMKAQRFAASSGFFSLNDFFDLALSSSSLAFRNFAGS